MTNGPLLGTISASSAFTSFRLRLCLEGDLRGRVEGELRGRVVGLEDARRLAGVDPSPFSFFLSFQRGSGRIP